MSRSQDRFPLDSYRARLEDAPPAVVRPLSNCSAHDLFDGDVGDHHRGAALARQSGLALGRPAGRPQWFATTRNEAWIGLTSAPGWIRTKDLGFEAADLQAYSRVYGALSCSEFG